MNIVVDGLGGSLLVTGGYGGGPAGIGPPPATGIAAGPLSPAKSRRPGRARPASPTAGIGLPPATGYVLSIRPAIAAIPGASYAGVFRLTMAATAPAGGPADPGVFLHCARPPAPGAVAPLAAFQAVCTAADLARYPAGAPWPDADPPFFRLAAMAADFRSLADATYYEATILAQVGGLLDDLAAMADQVADGAAAASAGGRSLAVAFTRQARHQPGVSGAFRMTAAVATASGLDPAIFLCAARPAPADPATSLGGFEKVCTAADLAAYPAGAPAAGAAPAFFRAAAIALDLDDRAIAAAVRALIASQVQGLLDAMALADRAAAGGPVILVGEDPLI